MSDQTFRVLCVEDRIGWRDRVQLALETYVPNVKLDLACSVSEGRSFIINAFSEQKAYDAAVLDFGLPAYDSAVVDSVDVSLCELLKSSFMDSNDFLVVHITSRDRDDPKIREHLADFHSRVGSPAADVVYKEDEDFSFTLGTTLRVYLINSQISSRMDNIFGQCHTETVIAASRRFFPTKPESATIEILNLTNDIMLHWQDLTGPVRKRVESVFVVEASASGVQISGSKGD